MLAPPIIRPPCTDAKATTPTESIYADAQRVFDLIEDERHLSALHLYNNVKERLNVPDSSSQGQENNTNKNETSTRRKVHNVFKRHKGVVDKEKDHEVEQARALFEEKKNELSRLVDRCEMFQKAKQNLDVDDDWTLAQTLFGVTTYYRRESDGSLSIKMEGRLSGTSLFEQVAVLREVDLHYKWAPFCSSSLTVAHLNKLDTVGWFVVGLPRFGLMRDACFRAVGCDSIFEDGSIMLVGQGLADTPKHGVKSKSLQKNTPTASSETPESEPVNNEGFDYLINDPILEQLDLPDLPEGMGSGRMTIRTFQAIIHIESPTEATARIVANVDPNLPLIPQSLIDFSMKKLCGVLLAKLQSAAKKVSKDPIHNDHAHLMRFQEKFYKGWLMEKFQQICKLREWVMPPVSCFELNDQDLEKAEKSFELRKKSSRKTYNLYQCRSDEKLDEFLARQTSGADSEPDMTAPRLRARTVDSDSLSDLSHVSGGSGWKSNPITKYLKEVEEKTAQRKQREIEKQRERAANRLKPKELDQSSRSRLDELRTARENRRTGKMAGQTPIVPNGAAKSERRTITSHYKNDWVTMWTNHSSTTRVVLISVFVVSLYVHLHANPLFERKIVDSFNWEISVERKRDVAAVMHLSLSTVLHFCLNYIAMMYSFSSLQLGMIAGREAVRFFSQHVHLIVAVSSVGMLLIAVARGFWVSSLQWLFSKAFCSEDLFDENGAVMTFFNKNVYSEDQVADACEEYEIEPWRTHAYSTIRVLFMYTATFLLLVLVLFNVTAKNATRSSTTSESKSIETVSTDDSDLSLPTSTKSAPLLTNGGSSNSLDGLRSASPLRVRAATFAFDTIEEGSQETVDVHPGPVVGNNGNPKPSRKSIALKKLRRPSTS
eukprot:scaffold22583_cov106-Cylindrotheca_fusiformis.AAC.31